MNRKLLKVKIMKYFARNAIALTLIVSPTLLFADVIADQKFGFTIEYDDGSKETAVLRYQAHVSTFCNQSGAVSKLTHPIDTRRVSWGVDSWIQRDVCLASRTLGEQCRGEWTKLFDDTRSGKSKEFNPLKGNFDHTTCGDVAGSISDARKDLSRRAIKSLKEVIDKDVNETFELLKKGGVKRIIQE